MATEPGRLYPMRRLVGAPVCATDGEAGRITTFLFDDERWVVRYVVVDMGGWLGGRDVLVSPAHLRRFDWAWTAGALAVDLTREQLEHAPELPTGAPPSRRYEAELNAYYGIADYWQGPLLWGAYPFPAGLIVPPPEPPPGAGSSPSSPLTDDVHVHRVDDVVGAAVVAADGEVGSLLDLLVDDVGWALHFLFVDARDASLGRRVLVPLDAVERLDWSGPAVRLTIPRDRVATMPDYDGSADAGRNLGIQSETPDPRT